MRYIENIVIGKPITAPAEMFAKDNVDWLTIEKDKTFYTNERFLPRILVDLGLYPSTSEIKKNKPELFITLDKVDFLELKVKKKRKIWILVGEYVKQK